MIITYLVFGNSLSNYCQAFFSILTFLHQKEENDIIVIVTDMPERFISIKDIVDIIVVNEETLNDWKGEYEFFWRIKIKALQLVSEKFKNRHIFYLDSDTFLFGDLTELKKCLDENNNLMHTNEGKLSELSSKTEKRMWNQVKNKNYIGIEVNSNICMWNAGVIGIAKNNLFQLNQILEVCDLLCRYNVTKRLIEQFSFSIVLNNNLKLLPAEFAIGHYWGNKDVWDNEIYKFISDCNLNCLSLSQQIDKAALLDFRKFPIRIKVPNTRKRLEKKLLFFFPAKEEVYITSK